MAAASVKSVAASVPFHDFCSLLERVSATRGTDKKKKLLGAFLEQWRSAHRALHGGESASAVSAGSAAGTAPARRKPDRAYFKVVFCLH